MLRWIGAVGLAGVALGAFGAHGLEAVLEKHGRVATWETAVFYHLVHVVAAWLALQQGLRTAALWFLAGLAVFSGTLYVLCLTQWTFLGAITPLGGIGMMVGWGCLLKRGGTGRDRLAHG